MLTNLPRWQRPPSFLVLTLLVFGASFFPGHTFAQTYNGSTTNTAGNSMIPSVNTGDCGVEPQTAGTGGTRFNCAVAGVAPGSVLDRVTVNLAHTSTGDLDIFLVSPSGAVLELSTDNGGSGDNFTNTVFRDNAPTSITAGTAPFTGSFRPEGTLIAVNCGITITPTVTTVVGMGTTAGTWQLLILDDAGAEVGAMINWSLTFVIPPSQTFNGSTTNTAGNSMIPSVNTGDCGVEPQTAGTGGTRFNCAVAGVAPGGLLDRVNVNLTHTSAGDLDIFLVSPSGAVLELSTDNGGSGDNFTNTVFRDNAPTSITAGTAPFTGSFRPEGTLIAVNCGITITPTVTTVVGMGTTAGTWQLLILDDAGTEVGAMINWSLTFVIPPSQTFNGSTTNTAGNSMIPSVNTGDCGVEPQTAGTGGTRFNCAVAGVIPGSVLYRVNVNFTHTSNGDLDIFLVSPSGAVLELSTDNGGSGDNFTNTVFRDNAPTNITAGIPPFSGPFRPEGTLTATTCGITVTPTVTTLLAMGTTAGTWQLLILDDAGTEVGIMNNWSLIFANSLSKDVDGDGYSDGVTTNSFPPPPGYDLVALSGDCNDNDPAINPAATEICADGVDNNCNGQVDEAGCVTPIPTLGTWAVWSLMILLAISGVAFLRNRVSTFSNPSKS